MPPDGARFCAGVICTQFSPNLFLTTSFSKYLLTLQTLHPVFLHSPSASMEEKPAATSNAHPLESELGTNADHSREKLQPTAHDVRDMGLFGIEPAFKRRFRFISMVGFASTVVM